MMGVSVLSVGGGRGQIDRRGDDEGPNHLQQSVVYYLLLIMLLSKIRHRHYRFIGESNKESTHGLHVMLIIIKPTLFLLASLLQLSIANKTANRVL
jgi:hypothetical protein